MESSKFQEYDAKIAYKNAREGYENGDVASFIGNIQKMKEIFEKNYFTITADFNDFDVIGLLIDLFSPEHPGEVRAAAYETLKTLILNEEISNEHLFRIIDQFAPISPHFDFPGIRDVHDLLKLCMKNDDCQQHLLACADLSFNQIASILLNEFSTEEDIEAAYYYVGSIFNFPTSERFAKTICDALLKTEDSKFKSYLIFKISCSMPMMMSYLGYDVVVNSIYAQLSIDDAEQNIQALICLSNVINENKGKIEFHFEPVFAKLESENDAVICQACSTLAALANNSSEGASYLLENGILEKSMEKAYAEGTTKKRIMFTRLIASIIASIDVSKLVEIINMDIVNALCVFIEIDDPFVAVDLIKAFTAILSANNEELSADTIHTLEENDVWPTIQEYSSNENEELSFAALRLISEFHTEIPSDDDEF